MALSFSCFSSSSLEIASIFLFLSSSIFLFPVSESTYFEITSFVSDMNNIIYSGDAFPSSGVVELNRVDYPMRVGHVTYADAIHIWDRKSGKLTDFTTRFTFVIDTLNRSFPTHGDALAFFLAPVGFQIPPNSFGGHLGLFNTTNNNSPQNQLVVVEFDTLSNEEMDPPKTNHLGINVNSVSSATFMRWNASLHSGDSAQATIQYNATTKMLMLSLRYGDVNTTSTANNTYNLSYKLDLRDIVSEWVTIGFSGVTGCAIERHIIRYWEFNSSLEADNDYSKINKLLLGLTIPLGILVVGGIATCVVFWWRPRRKNAQESDDIGALTSINEVLERGSGPKRFLLRDLALATSNFSDDQKLGEGGFGCVYKGYLSRESAVVAVKRISQGSTQGKKEYMTEVKIISNLRHRNLVQLIGWCHDDTQFLLVYEFMPNGSLDHHLFNKKTTLKWDVRYNIATGLAFALLYLHEECEQCIVHRYIKTSNVLLDSGFNAKLGDFGLARIMDHEVGLKTTGLAGTLGYIASGKKATDQVEPDSDLGLVEWVWSFLGKSELFSCVDPMLNKEFNRKEVERLMMVGLWCSHPDQNLRPSIHEVIQVIKFEGALPNLPTKMPVPVYFTAPDTFEVSSSTATMTNNKI